MTSEGGGSGSGAAGGAVSSGPVGGGVAGGASGTGGGGGGGSGSMAKKRKPLISQLSTDTRDLHDNLAIAAAATQNQAITQRRVKKSLDVANMVEADKPQGGSGGARPVSVVAGETVMKSAELQLMTPLLNFLQLLCENHNIKLQVGPWWWAGHGGGGAVGVVGCGVRAAGGSGVVGRAWGRGCGRGE